MLVGSGGGGALIRTQGAASGLALLRVAAERLQARRASEARRRGLSTLGDRAATGQVLLPPRQGMHARNQNSPWRLHVLT